MADTIEPTNEALIEAHNCAVRYHQTTGKELDAVERAAEALRTRLTALEAAYSNLESDYARDVYSDDMQKWRERTEKAEAKAWELEAELARTREALRQAIRYMDNRGEDLNDYFGETLSPQEIANARR